jgi:hypothetical protein
MSEGEALFEYSYELRRDEQILVTGHFDRDQPLNLGDPIAIAGYRGLVRRIEPQLGEPRLHLIIETIGSAWG